MSKVEMLGSIENVGMKVDASSNLIKELKLGVQGDLSSLQELMKQPLKITFEPLQATFGQPAPEIPATRKPRSR